MSRLALFAALAGSLAVTPAWGQAADEGMDLDAAYHAELLADAGARSSLLDGDTQPGSGWANGRFFMGSGDNVLNIGGFVQTRYLQNFRDDQPDSNDFTHGFQLRRTRLIASGNVWDKRLTFQVQGDFARNTGTFTLLDAYARYQWDSGWSMRMGQYKLPLLREELVGDPTQLTVERSLVNVVFTQNRSQGIEVGYQQKEFRAMFDLSDGLNTLNTDFNSTAEADIAATLRGEWLFTGDEFKRFDDNTSWQDSTFAGMLGAAVHYQTGGETGGTIDNDIAEATIDCSLEGNGWNAFVEGVWRNTDPAAGDSRDDFGVLAQGGVFVTNQLELFARYDVVIPDVGDNFNTATAGLSYYISPRSHAVKFTGDIVYYFDDTASAGLVGATNTSVNLLPEGDGGEVGVRLQLLFIF